MKLLFDQNISFRIISKLKSVFPDSVQVREIGLENSTDKEIWSYAKRNEYVIVTFDSDFYDFSLVWGSPPKIVLIKSHNQTTNYIAEILIDQEQTIRRFSEDDTIACLEIVKTRPNNGYKT
jgi:predicted nuclease of predicted toxin-antitoxin system